MIPTKEQFIDLKGALNNNIDFIAKRLDYIHPDTTCARPDLSEILTENELREFIKLDVGLYVERFKAVQNLPAWIWLYTQQNFIRAKDRLFKGWLSEEQLSNGLNEYIAKLTVFYFETKMKKRESLILNGVTPNPNEAWLVDRSPLELFQGSLGATVQSVTFHQKWVSGVARALSNYHYGEANEMTMNRRNRVESLIAAWENLSEQVELAHSDAELVGYLDSSVHRIVINRRLIELRALHQSGALYFISRNDETISERLFIREMALLHRKLFGQRSSTSAIADLFYLDGMKSAPTERTIQRTAKSAIANWSQKENVVSEALDIFWRQKR